MVMPASVIIVGGAVEPELSKPFDENDVLHNKAHASLEIRLPSSSRAWEFTKSSWVMDDRLPVSAFTSESLAS